MPKLEDARLAKTLVMKDGVRTLKDSIIDREEFVCAIPSEFPVVLGFVASGEPKEQFSATVDVLSHMSQPIWSATENCTIGTNNLEGYMQISIPALDVGPCYVLLKFNNAEVWRQRIFFARA